ncbi:MAG: hypothetical protein K0B02_00985 [DPANN group archaeon]|nr:hypothetical protein [DPANN group archaeon]
MDTKKPRRYHTTISVKPLETPDFESLMSLLYRGSKNVMLPDHAYTFLKELRQKGNNGVFDRSNWDIYCKEHNISKTTYYSMINKLIGIGLIETKERDYYKLSNRCERFFESIVLAVKAFSAKKYNYNTESDTP